MRGFLKRRYKTEEINLRQHAFRDVAAIFLILGASISAPATAADGRYTLEESYRLALERSKTVAGQVALIEQAAARIHQARAAFYPNLNVVGTFLRQDTPSSALAQNIFPADQDTVRANASQNLFKGFRDLATLEQRKFARNAAEFAREQAEVQLFTDVAQAFYDTLNRQTELRNYRAEIAAASDRRRELLEFKRAARAREADVATVEVAIATLEAAIANTRGLLEVAQETLAFLTGLPPGADLVESRELPADVPALDFWLQRLDDRPDVRQASANVRAAEEGIEAARAGHRPSLDLSANYYAERPGINEDIDWDVQLSVTQPLFTGGLVQAQVREAAAQRQANEMTLAQVQEVAARDIRALYRTLQSNLDQVQRLARAADLAQRNYELLRKDNRAGLASNLDVLQALANLHQTRRGLDTARYAAKNNYARLRAIAARRNDEAAATGVPAAR